MLEAKIQIQENAQSGIENLLRQFSEALDSAARRGGMEAYEPDLSATLMNLKNLTRILQADPDLYVYARDFNLAYANLAKKVQARKNRSLEDGRLEEFKQNYINKLEEELRMVWHPSFKGYIKSCIGNFLDASLQYCFSGSPLIASSVALTGGIQASVVNLMRKPDLWSVTPLFSAGISCALGEGIRYACGGNPYATIVLATIAKNLVNRIDNYLRIKREAAQKQEEISKKEEEIKTNRMHDDVELISELIQQIKNAKSKIAEFRSKNIQSPLKYTNESDRKTATFKNQVPAFSAAPIESNKTFPRQEYCEKVSLKKLDRRVGEVEATTMPRVLVFSSLNKGTEKPKSVTYAPAVTSLKAGKILKKRKRCENLESQKAAKRSENSTYPGGSNHLTFRTSSI